MTEFFGERQPAAVLKHAILEKYLPVYVGKTGSNSWKNRVGYIDGFAGPGLYADGSAGSPAVAVDTLRALSSFTTARDIDGHLVEENPESGAALREYLTTEGLDWKVYDGDVEAHLPTILDALPTNEAAFFFLDPFGLGVPFEMLERIMARAGTLKFGYRTNGAATELLLNFSLPGLWRNAGHLTSTSTDETYRTKTRKTLLDRVDASMGGTWWREIWENEPKGERDRKILDRYIEKLSKLCGGHVWAIPCADKWNGPPSYWLIHVTQHPDGAWEFHQALSKASEIYRTACFEGKQEGLFDDKAFREQQWVDEITKNIRELLGKGGFTVQDRMHEVYGDATGFARDMHIRKAIKALFKEGVTSTNGVGDIQTMRVKPA